jgi:hypothetical protein
VPKFIKDGLKKIMVWLCSRGDYVQKGNRTKAWLNLRRTSQGGSPWAGQNPLLHFKLLDWGQFKKLFKKRLENRSKNLI